MVSGYAFVFVCLDPGGGGVCAVFGVCGNSLDETHGTYIHIYDRTNCEEKV